MINLNEYKDLKRMKLIYEDLVKIQAGLTTSLEVLKPYGKYVPVMESLSILHNSRTLIEININKYKRLIDESKPAATDKI
jgi:hypothetical protein